MILNETISTAIQEQFSILEEKGEVLPNEKLAEYYRLFRDKFGPERLAEMDGETLLTSMHDSSNRNSLVYWLEFKNDEELPGRFGSIAGGSALKFGIYKRGDSGNWMTGSSQKQVVLNQDEAIRIARKHRDQLLAGYKVLEAFPDNTSDEEYATLQTEMARVAPDVHDTAWGHKYFYMMFPTKLDDFHNAYYQRFHLMRMLQIPVSKEGRYSVAGQYVAIARELGLHLNNLTQILVKLNGEPYKYWSIKVNFVGFPKEWKSMKEGGYVAIGWDQLGDLSEMKYERESKNQIKALMLEKYKEKGGFAQEIFYFVTVIKKGDIILATEKSGSVLGIGKVTSDYYYVPEDEYPNRLKVDWFSDKTWETPVTEIKGRVVKQILIPENIVSVENHLLGLSPLPPTEETEIEFSGKTRRIQEVLERKKQIILYGPPGTGKTYWAYQATVDIVSKNIFNTTFNELDDQKKGVITGDHQNLGYIRICTFHPSYGYEDFMEGYRPESNDGVLSFQLRQGIFKRLCHDAALEPDKKFYLIIDEINRGDIPRIFGELLTVLEKDKRGRSIILPISGERFSVPENVYVVGTMNTADRSIALLDTALRRRFGFIELMPDPTLLGDAVLNGIPLKAWLESLNNRIIQSLGRDARNRQIVHAYFLENGKPLRDYSRFVRVIREDVIPLLEEYCYEDYEALEKILGKSMVDREIQKIREDFFDENHRDNLLRAFLETSPELATASIVVQNEEAELDSEEETEEIT